MSVVNSGKKVTRLVLGIALLNLIIHLLTNGQYGFHRDELYMIDCAKHLSFGYADMPPLTPFFAKVTISLFGETLRGLRLFPALLSSAIVFLTAIMARELGGKPYAQVLAAITILVAPIFLVAGTQFQTIPVDQFFWVMTCYLLTRFINTGNQKLWLVIGFTLGLGLMVKYSMAFLAAGILTGMITSEQRKIFMKKWIWIGAFIAAVVFLPNILWQIQNGFPVFEHMQALGQDESTPRLQFLFEQLLILHPLNLPVWGAGILFLLVSKQGRKYRPLIWIYAIPLIIFLIMKGKSYYLAPAYPVLLAGGAVLIEQRLLRSKRIWIKFSLPALLLLSAIVTSPVWLPVLPVEKMKDLGIAGLRYDYREMIGWPDLVESVSKVYHGLSEQEQKKTMIITGNYGEAGAINHYGPAVGLPGASSGISSYYYWGPGNPDATTFIFVGYPEDYLTGLFSEVTVMETIQNQYGIENEEQGQLVILCRGSDYPLTGLWEAFKHY